MITSVEEYVGPCQIFVMEFFRAKSCELLLLESLIIDVLQDPKYTLNPNPRNWLNTLKQVVGFCRQII